MTQTTEPNDSSPISAQPDIINELAGITEGSPLYQLRSQRPDAVRYAQGSYLALLEPEDPAGVSRYERDLIALHIATLASSAALAEHHRARLRQLGASDESIAAIEQFPNGPALPERQAAILRHAALLTTDPGGANKAAIAALRAQGLGARDIVTIAQLIAFLSFQTRLLDSLRLFAEEV